MGTLGRSNLDFVTVHKLVEWLGVCLAHPTQKPPRISFLGEQPQNSPRGPKLTLIFLLFSSSFPFTHLLSLSSSLVPFLSCLLYSYPFPPSPPSPSQTRKITTTSPLPVPKERKERKEKRCRKLMPPSSDSPFTRKTISIVVESKPENNRDLIRGIF